jgi:DNA polymerase-3 subunit epsilon
MKFSDYKRIIVLDFETSGLDANRDKIIEVGAIIYEYNDSKFFQIETLNFLVNSVVVLPDIITEITGIEAADLREFGILSKDAYLELKRVLQDNTLIVGYNVNFDYGFLIQLFNSFNDNLPDYDILDIMTLYKDYGEPPYKLVNAASTLQVELGEPHHASGDCITTFNVMYKLIELGVNAEDYINYYGYLTRFRTPSSRNGRIKFYPQEKRGDILKIIQKNK